MKTILFVLAPRNFRDAEYLVPRAFFEQNGYNVVTTSLQKESVGTFGFRVQNDFLLDEAEKRKEEFDAIFFVGGVGSLDYGDNKTVQKLTEYFVSQKKVIGAICAAPRNLLKWGILAGKKCTGNNWDNNFPNLCQEAGAIYVAEKVVADGGIVTGDGPEAGEIFAQKFMEQLS